MPRAKHGFYSSSISSSPSKAQILGLLVSIAAAIAVASPQLEHFGTDSDGSQSCDNIIRLPAGACLWDEDAKTYRAPCDFEVLDVEFLKVLGKAPKLEFITEGPANEGGIYFPDNEEFYFSSNWSLDELPANPANLMKLSLRTGEISLVLETLMANGMALDNNGELVLCEQGLFSEPGSVTRVNLYNLSTSVVADNWTGLPFNSPNDVVVKSDNSIWFTDPNYGEGLGFKGTSQLPNQVYRVSAAGDISVVADGFEKPNGVAFSQDEKLFYVTDTGSSLGNGTIDPTLPHSITVFDVENSTLTNRRLFASVGILDGNASSVGIPDGIKLDTEGRVYVACKDGIQVFSTGGKLIGLIRIAGAINMGFVGPNLSRMIVTNFTGIHSVQLDVLGADLAYAKAYLHLDTM